MNSYVPFGLLVKTQSLEVTVPPDEKQAGSRRLWSTTELTWWPPKSFLALFHISHSLSRIWIKLIHTAMNKKQGDRIRSLASLMYEMDLQLSKPRDRYGHGKLRQFLIQLSFFLPPVEIILPRRDQSFDLVQGHTQVPFRVVELVGEGGEVELLVKDLEL